MPFYKLPGKKVAITTLGEQFKKRKKKLGDQVWGTSSAKSNRTIYKRTTVLSLDYEGVPATLFVRAYCMAAVLLGCHEEEGIPW